MPLRVRAWVCRYKALTRLTGALSRELAAVQVSEPHTPQAWVHPEQLEVLWKVRQLRVRSCSATHRCQRLRRGLCRACSHAPAQPSRHGPAHCDAVQQTARMHACAPPMPMACCAALAAAVA